MVPATVSSDVTTTLADLERRLVELERELAGVAGTSPSAPPPKERVEAMRNDVDELVQLNEQLEATAQTLVARVEVRPFSDISAVERFERQIAALPGVRKARVRKYKDGRATIDVTLEREG